MKEKRVSGYREAAFDVLYLGTVLVLGVALLLRGDARWRLLAGIMALVLLRGDAFHLVPRVGAVLTGAPERFRRALGLGKLIASLTMTVFYLLLWHIGLMLLGADVPFVWTGLLYGLAALRALLCLLPQNRWTEYHPPVRWGIWRNIPFLLIGLAVALLYGLHGGTLPYLRWMWVAIALSFAFYMPVVIGAHRYPWLGMLMLPKSAAYIWIISLCLLA